MRTRAYAPQIQTIPLRAILWLARNLISNPTNGVIP